MKETVVERTKTHSATPQSYSSVRSTLRDRLLILIPRHPEILTLGSISGLLAIPEFEFTDLAPSRAQVAWSLAAARREWHRIQQG